MEHKNMVLFSRHSVVNYKFAKHDFCLTCILLFCVMNSTTPSQETQGTQGTQGTFVAEIGPSTSSTHTGRYIPGGKIIDCCTLCDYGIITVTCGICFRETHKKCAEAFLRGTDKKIDVNLDCWRCPRCLTMVHLIDPTSCEEKKEKKNKRSNTNQKKRWCKC